MRRYVLVSVTVNDVCEATLILQFLDPVTGNTLGLNQPWDPMYCSFIYTDVSLSLCLLYISEMLG